MTRSLGGLWRALTRPRSLGLTRGRRSRGGVALLMVITTVVVLTMLVSELSYGSTVRLQVAAHQRDRAQAYWLARSGVSLYRLILTANKQLENSEVGSMIEQYTGMNVGDALWQLLPVINTGLLRMVFASGGDVSDVDDEQLDQFKATGRVSDEVAEKSRSASLFSERDFLDFDGDFSAEIIDEESKINVNTFSSRNESMPLSASPTYQQLRGLMSGEENDQWLRDRNLDRDEVISNLADWVDSDGLRCGPQGGYEDNLYNRLDSDYLTKNAPFDSKEEIRLVEGWQDDVMDRFGENLTVWGAGKLNINTASDEAIIGLLKAYVTPQPSDATCQLILEQIAMQRLLSDWNNGTEFSKFIEGLGYEVDPSLAVSLSKASYTFTITSTGLVRDSAVTITAVVDYGSKGGTVGRVLYWRVD